MRLEADAVDRDTTALHIHDHVVDSRRLAVDPRDVVVVVDQLSLWISGAGTLEGQIDPELDMAHLETFLHEYREARLAGQKSAASDWREKAVELIRLIESQHGPFWLQRAETRLTVTMGGDVAGGQWDALVRAAKTFFLRGQYDKAVDAYSQAAEEADRAGLAASAFQFAFHGSADLGFIALSLALSDKGKQGVYWMIPDAEEVVQKGCVVKRTKNSVAAFLAFFEQESTRSILNEFGYK